MLKLSTPEQQDHAQAQLKALFQAPAVDLKNVGTVLALEASGRFAYRGKSYVVPPVPYTQGLQLHQIFLRLQALGSKQENEAALQELFSLMSAAVMLFKGLVRPTSWWQRLTWRWQQPFADVTEKEVGELMGFFFVCRMKSSIVIPGVISSEVESLSTPLMTSPPLSGITPSGAKKAGITPEAGRSLPMA
jgi:hypothetical protein